MKSFLIKSLYFSILIIIALIVLELWGRSQTNTYTIKRDYTEKYKDSIECLILGSSHTFNGINPAFLSPKAVNMANSSQPILNDAAIIYRYAEIMPRIKYIIVPISTFSLYSETLEPWITTACNIYYGVNMTPFNPKYHLAALELPTIREQAALINPCSDNGFGTSCKFENRPKNWRNHLKALKRHTTKSLRGENYDQNLAAVKSMAEYCKKRGIKLLLITTPVIKEYRDNANKEQLADMYRNINSIREEYPEITYVDFLSDSDFVDDDFYDSDHLCEIGAKKLTLKVDSILTLL